MPLQPGSSRKVISENIHELTHFGSRPRSHKQIVAIALSNADRHPRARRAAGGIGAAAPTGFTGENPINAGEKSGPDAGWSGNDFGNAAITAGGFVPGAPMGAGLAAGVGKGIFDDISYGGDQPNNNHTSFFDPAGTTTGEKGYWAVRNAISDAFGGNGPAPGPAEASLSASPNNYQSAGKGSMGLDGALSSAYNSIIGGGSKPTSSTATSMSGSGSAGSLSGPMTAMDSGEADIGQTSGNSAPTSPSQTPSFNFSAPQPGLESATAADLPSLNFSTSPNFGGGFNDVGQSSLYTAGPTSAGFSLGGLGSANFLPGGMKRGGLADAQHLAFGGPSYFERTEARQMMDPFHPGGLITSDVAGRTDRIAHSVAADSFVIPADVISGIGQGNSLAGAKIMDGILSSGPFGTRLPRGGRLMRADGGSTPSDGLSHVLLAGGEYSVPRHKVDEIGHRMRRTGKSRARTDNAAGQEALRELVSRVRQFQMKFLKNAPRPKA